MNEFDYQKELDSFFKDVEVYSKKLKLIIDDFDKSDYKYDNIKFNLNKPVYLNNVKIYIKQKNKNSLF